MIIRTEDESGSPSTIPTRAARSACRLHVARAFANDVPAIAKTLRAELRELGVLEGHVDSMRWTTFGDASILKVSVRHSGDSEISVGFNALEIPHLVALSPDELRALRSVLTDQMNVG